jgi:MYXO-CTERM domain-containing protein
MFAYMKKAGILAVLIASFSLVFAAPGASANRWEGIEPRGTVDMTAPARFNDNDTLGEDMREGYQGMKNGMQRAANRVENGVDRATNRMENGVNRATNRVDNGMNRAFDTRDNNNGRYNTLNTTNNGYRATAATTTNDRGFSWGWLGLLGLLGLAGMRNRDRDRA